MTETDPPPIGNIDPPLIHVTYNVNGTAEISGLTAGDQIVYTTSGTHNHVLIDAVSGANFDIGGFSISQSETTSLEVNNVKFDDDAPTITLVTDGQVTHDETPGLQDDDVAAAALPAALTARLTALGLSGEIGQAMSGAAVVSPVGGADGVASLALGVQFGGVSGLTAVDGGAVTLAVDAVLDNLVIGTDTDGDTVLAIYLGLDGKVSAVQYEALGHPDGANPDDRIDIDDGVLFAIVTDGDGDQAEVDIGERVNFDDDGPAITTVGVEPTATVDETVLATNATADFSANFAPVFGTDGPGNLTYALGVSAPGVASGLIDTATGNQVFLFLEAGVVVGRETGALGAVVFTASVDGLGVVTLDQQRAVVHPDITNHDDAVTLLSDELVTLTATVADGDTDSAAATLNIGQNLSFEDDGPAISTTGVEPNLLVDETVLATNASASFAANFASVFGEDGAGSVAYALAVSAPGFDSGLIDTATGNPVLLFLEAGVVVGREGGALGAVVFTASVDNLGVVSLDQQRAVVHPDITNHDDAKTLISDAAVSLIATVTDKDGDTANAVLGIGQNLIFEDDGPSITTAGIEPNLLVDETVLGTDAAASFAANFVSAFGEDGAGTLDYALNVSAPGVDSGLVDTATGNSVFAFNEGGLIVGREGTDAVDAVTGAIVFTASVDALGAVSLDQQRAVIHPDATNPDDAKTLADDSAITLTATVTDKDGDSAVAALNIGQNLIFEDDGPASDIADGGGQVIIDETANNQDDDNDGAPVAALFAAVANQGVDLVPTEYAISGTPLVTTAGSLGGADGIASTVLSLEVVGGNGTDSGLDTTSGQSVLLFKEGDLIVGRTAAGASAVFAIALQQDGNAAVAQYASLGHPDDSNPDDRIDLTGKVTAVATVTDKDGDQSTDSFGIGDKINFDDDGPTLAGVDDSTNSLVFAAGISETKPFDFVVGADNEEPSGVTLTDFTNPDDAADLAASGLGELETLLGTNITAQLVGNVVTYSTPTQDLFRFTVTDADWTFDILADAPLVFNEFDFSTLASGGPKEILSLQADNSNTVGVFNGYLFGPLDAPNGTEARGTFPPNPQDFPLLPVDDLNPDNIGFGVKQGAASNMNNNEGFSVTFHEGTPGGALKTVEGLQFKIDQQGNTDDVVMSFELVNGVQGSGNDPNIMAIETGGLVNLIASENLAIVDDGSFWIRLGLPTGNVDRVFTILDDDFIAQYTPQANEIVIYVDGTYDTAFFRMAFPNNGTFNQYPGQVNDSVRIKDITLIEQAPTPDLHLQFAMQGIDGDGDQTVLGVANIFVSEDGSLVV